MIFVDTSVWSLALRRDTVPNVVQVDILIRTLSEGAGVTTTGLVLQELLQGFAGPKMREQIIDKFSAIPLLSPDRTDHIEAAAIRNRCRKAGVQIGTIDATIAQLCIRHELPLLTTDKDFEHMAKKEGLRLAT